MPTTPKPYKLPKDILNPENFKHRFNTFLRTMFPQVGSKSAKSNSSKKQSINNQSTPLLNIFAVSLKSAERGQYYFVDKPFNPEIIDKSSQPAKLLVRTLSSTYTKQNRDTVEPVEITSELLTDRFIFFPSKMQAQSFVLAYLKAKSEENGVFIYP